MNLNEKVCPHHGIIMIPCPDDSHLPETSPIMDLDELKTWFLDTPASAARQPKKITGSVFRNSVFTFVTWTMVIAALMLVLCCGIIFILTVNHCCTDKAEPVERDTFKTPLIAYPGGASENENKDSKMENKDKECDLSVVNYFRNTSNYFHFIQGLPFRAEYYGKNVTEPVLNIVIFATVPVSDEEFNKLKKAEAERESIWPHFPGICTTLDLVKMKTLTPSTCFPLADWLCGPRCEKFN